MLKLIKIMSIILVLLILPVNTSAMDYEETLEIFTEKTDLDTLIEDHQTLLDDYDDRYLRFVKMSSWSSYSYHVAYSAINKTTGKLRLLWEIEESKENILKTKADVLLSYRNKFYSLHKLEKTMNTSYDSYMQAIEDYKDSLALYNNGYLNEMKTILYSKQSAYYSYMSAKRRYEQAVRDFNISIEKEYQFTDYDFAINEELLMLDDLDTYISYVLENSDTIKKYDRLIEEYSIKINYLGSYCLQVTSYSASYDYNKAVINKKINELKKEQYIEEILLSIQKTYDELIINEHEIDNMKLQITINKDKMDENYKYYQKGFIEKEEYQIFVTTYKESLEELEEKIYSYNTAILELEYMSCFYMKGEF